MKKNLQDSLLLLLVFALFSCNNQPKKTNGAIKENLSVSKIPLVTKQLLQAGNENPFIITLTPEATNYYLPALQSYAETSYNGLWIIIGGQVEGFHGTSNNPAPFKKSVANDSMWVVDVANGKSYGAPVPKQYLNSLAVSNPQSYRDGDNFYLCGGYTVSDSSQKNFNTTSNSFFKINIPSFIQYVKSGGTSPALNQVFPIVIKNNFVRVTGGELFVENNNFYLIGGQDYEGAYSDGVNGSYTNSIRSFKLLYNGKSWMIANTNSIVDSVNLHRRDFNLVPYVASNGSLDAILFGGVFTPNGLSYNSPIYISGLSTGKPTITKGTTQQKCNQYTCAIAPMYVSPGGAMMYGLIGGISYMKYDTNKGSLVIGDNGMAMPFSNLVDFMISNGDSAYEYVQTPPQSLLPGYLGSNASFFPVPQLTVDGHENILDLNKIFVGTPTDLKIGYMYGGILSNGPTSGTTPEGHVNTYANPVLYAVHISLDLSKTKNTQQ
jgi:hypothetical protein